MNLTREGAMNFLLSEMTYLKYFIPLIIEGNKRGIESTLYICPCHRINGASKDHHRKQIEILSKKYLFNIKDIGIINKIEEKAGLTFMVEGQGVKYLSELKRCIKVSLSYMSDFKNLENEWRDIKGIYHPGYNGDVTNIIHIQNTCRKV